jgi:hypothetical protein
MVNYIEKIKIIPKAEQIPSQKTKLSLKLSEFG